ncbi:TetR/AcrR family transcriptional regulator [Brevibacterium album]|uniref:TetR/AcrR family transcriptional regulator n=1 Tax=Brevibacterium album TaxID=417948 RepID=UPI0003FBC27D|nr:TetR/AcrR family transcriptional regulator [Brevibacterium album]
MAGPRRTHAQARAEMREGIIRVGNALLAQNGAAGLSVRAIARELGVASSALYRHVSSRDELLTLLLVEAYSELAGRVEAALMGAEAPTGADSGAEEGVAESGPPPTRAIPEEGAGREGRAASAAVRLAVLVRAMRGWACENPEKWALVYGSPVPGYAAPPERTVGPGTAVLGRFMAILAEGSGAGETEPEPSERYGKALAAGSEELGVEVPVRTAAASAEVWTGLLGLISAEVFRQLGADLAEHGEEMLELWTAEVVRRFGLE